MAGLRIYYVPPRLVGSIARWSGKDAPGGRSWLVEQAKSMGFNALWLSPLHVTSQVEKWKHGRRQTGSLYAIRDHFSLDAEFGAGDGSDLAHLKHFCAQARAAGIRPMADLVFNHVAMDHPLVGAENQAITDKLAEWQRGNQGWHKVHATDGSLIGIRRNNDSADTLFFKFARNDDLSCFIDGPSDDRWIDVLKINYASPAAMEHFVTGANGQPGYWKKLVDWYMDLGFKGFRCDVAYAVPPKVWSEVLGHAKARDADCVTLAETLGGPQNLVERLGRAQVTVNGQQQKAFDLGMLGIYWWDFQNSYFPNMEIPLVERAARLGGAGSPDNHDTAETIGGRFLQQFAHHPERDRIVADIALRDYAVSALACNSVYMQMGYEYAKETQNEVFKGCGSPQEWDHLVQMRGGAAHGLNLCARIAAINALKEKLDVADARVRVAEIAHLGHGQAVRMKIEYQDPQTQKVRASIQLMINLSPERGPVHLHDGEYRHIKSGMGPALERLEFGQPDRDRPHELRDVIILHSPPPAPPVQPFMAPQPQRPRRRPGQALALGGPGL